ncbi:RNA polymerase II elongation factor ELL-like [Antedon mediterranea]|uniref:RNA polymerase II elongation factor ELL-like n=1 Tax=Antedon mediterranea TaxID=105859 RepID=UPI003AF42F96
MADLKDNEQYVFDRSKLSNRNKTVLLLKLTDTSLKVLEDFQKIKNGPKRKGSISFNSNQGTISLPGVSGCREFKIQVTTLPDNSCECLQHKHYDQIESIGCIMNKVTIKATDDSYTATSDKMKQAEEELKKVSTKVIEQKGLKQGRKVKIRTPTSTLQKFQSKKTESAIPPWKQKTTLSKPSIVQKPSTPSTPMSNSSCSSNGSSSSGYSSASQNSNSSNTSSPKQTSKYPCRDHIIHALAVRPYKRVELILKLSKEGFSGSSKDKISSTLQQVASAKDNSYTLLRHIYNEVREDWPLYSTADRDILKGKLQQFNQKQNEENYHPKPTTEKESKPKKPPKAVKRPILPEIADYKLPKIQKRIAHSKKGDEKTVCTPSSPSEVTTSKNSPKYDNDYVDSNADQKAPSPTEGVSSTSSTPEYMSNFQRITNPEQRLKYKNVFNEEYKEYLNVYKKIENVQCKFSDLKERLSKVDRNSSEYERIENQVLEEYEKIQEDEKYAMERARFDELHGKLGFIKRLVLEYDNAQQELT